RYLMLPRARVQAEEKFLIVWRKRLQLDIHWLADILRRSSRWKLVYLCKFFVLSSFPPEDVRKANMHRFWQNSIQLFIVLSLSFSPAFAQTGNSDQSYKAERQKAIDLFNENKYLEALPLFEDLIKQNPQDAEARLGLASCLLSQAATLENDAAAIKERLRAREMLLKARELGNNSTLLQNLLQLIPEDGRIAYSKNPVDQAMQKGEAAFARNDYAEAVKNYSKALELDPTNYSAALFVGDSYFGAKNWAKAGEWYEKAI